MREQKEAPELSTPGERTPTTSKSAPALNLEKVGASPMPPCPSTIVATIGMTKISHKFLQILVDS